MLLLTRLNWSSLRAEFHVTVLAYKVRFKEFNENEWYEGSLHVRALALTTDDQPIRSIVLLGLAQSIQKELSFFVTRIFQVLFIGERTLKIKRKHSREKRNSKSELGRR